VLVGEPHFFDLADFLANTHALGIVNHLVGQLLLRELGPFSCTPALCEERIQQVLFLCI